MRNMSLATARLEALRKEEEAKVARGRPGHAPWAADFWQDGKGGGEKGSGEGSSGASPPPPPEPARRAPAEAPGVFGKYSWDQSDKAVTLYFPVDAPTAEETSHEFTEVGVRVTHARGGAVREFKLTNLCHPIDKFKSKLLLKKDRIQAKMVKYVPGEEWSALDDVEDKKRQNGRSASRTATSRTRRRRSSWRTCSRTPTTRSARTSSRPPARASRSATRTARPAAAPSSFCA